jgi:uncharacterized membrane protein
VLNIPPIEVAVALWFLLCWAGYTWFAGRKAQRSASLLMAMRKYRYEWFTAMITRENRVGDLIALNNLSTSSSFLASTCLLILGGLAALLGGTQEFMSVVSEIPFAKRETELVWRMKIILLIVVFVYAFFRFTWSIRQYNFCVVLVSAAPAPTDQPEAHKDFIDLVTNLASFSAENFNQGLRAFYFALAAPTWFLHPWLFVFASAAVVLVLYMREFRSRTLYALMSRPAHAPAPEPPKAPSAALRKGGGL